MKQTAKEKLNDKARKMIDLIYDEVIEGGEKEISSSFIDVKFNKKCTLSVKINVSPKGVLTGDSLQVPDIIGDNGVDDDF